MFNVTKKDDIFLQDVLNEFDTLWNNSYIANDEFLLEYSNFLQKQKKEFVPSFSFKKDIKRNFMQEKALRINPDLNRAPGVAEAS